jgi:hypothetical protein
MNMEWYTLSSAVPNKLTDLEVTEIADNCTFSGTERRLPTTSCARRAHLITVTINYFGGSDALNPWK